MSLSDHQIRDLFRSDTHFPSRFPHLADLQISEVTLPGWGQAGQQKTRKAGGGGNSVFCLQITETRPAIVQRIVALDEVRSIFLPAEADRDKLNLDEGVWLLGPHIQDEQQAEDNLKKAKGAVARGNQRGLGIAFVAESARVLNIVSVAASAEESSCIEECVKTPKGDPCC
jgi:hypothetical protein